jgi:hypothetical protein
VHSKKELDSGIPFSIEAAHGNRVEPLMAVGIFVERKQIPQDVNVVAAVLSDRYQKSYKVIRVWQRRAIN